MLTGENPQERFKGTYFTRYQGMNIVGRLMYQSFAEECPLAVHLKLEANLQQCCVFQLTVMFRCTVAMLNLLQYPLGGTVAIYMKFV